MNKLGIIVATEYKSDIKNKSFWIATFLVPIIFILFGIFVGILSANSDAFASLQKSMGSPSDEDNFSGSQAMGMMMGVFLVLFIMMYGSQIFNKVKIEKCNRIVEVLATCVTGRTMMLGKIITVALTGLTQIVLWAILIISGAAIILITFNISVPTDILLNPKLYFGILWSILFFVGGYILFGSLFAAIGAMTDKNNENQEYVAVLTFILIASFYTGMFAVDNGNSLLAIICSYVPFTSPSVACVNAITQAVPLWQSILSVLVLYGFAMLSLSISGKIYTSSLLLKGKRFTPRDIITFFKSK